MSRHDDDADSSVEISVPSASKQVSAPSAVSSVVGHNQPPPTGMSLISMAIERGAGLDVIEKLMALQERHDAINARKAFDAAISAVRANLPTIIKNKRVKFDSKTGGAKTDYAYEDLAGIVEQVSPVLAEAGVSFRFRTNQPQAGVVAVTCIVAHAMGHSEENTLIANIDTSGNKNHIQAIGSAVTYLSRYALKAALGLAASEDDDGEGSAPRGGDKEINVPSAGGGGKKSTPKAQQASSPPPKRAKTDEFPPNGRPPSEWALIYIDLLKSCDSLDEVDLLDKNNDRWLEEIYNGQRSVYKEIANAMKKHKEHLSKPRTTAAAADKPKADLPKTSSEWSGKPDAIADYEGLLDWCGVKLREIEDGETLERFWNEVVETSDLMPPDREDLLSEYRKAEHRIGG